METVSIPPQISKFLTPVRNAEKLDLTEFLKICRSAAPFGLYVVARKNLYDFCTVYADVCSSQYSDLSLHVILSDATLHPLVFDVDVKCNGNTCDGHDCISDAFKSFSMQIEKFIASKVQIKEPLLHICYSSKNGGFHVIIPEIVISHENFAEIKKIASNFSISCDSGKHIYEIDTRCINFPLPRSTKKGDVDYRMTHMSMSGNAYSLPADIKIVREIAEKNVSKLLTTFVGLRNEQQDILAFPFCFSQDLIQYRLLSFPCNIIQYTEKFRSQIEYLKNETFTLENCNVTLSPTYVKLMEIGKTCINFTTNNNVVMNWMKDLKEENECSLLQEIYEILQEEIKDSGTDPITYLLEIDKEIFVPLLYASCNIIRNVSHVPVCHEFARLYGNYCPNCAERLMKMDTLVVNEMIKNFSEHTLRHLCNSVLYEMKNDEKVFADYRNVDELTLLRENAYLRFESLFLQDPFLNDFEEDNGKRKRTDPEKKKSRLSEVCTSIITKLISCLFPVVVTMGDNSVHQSFIWISQHWCDMSCESNPLKVLIEALLFELNMVFGEKYCILQVFHLVKKKVENHFSLENLKKSNAHRKMDVATHLLCLADGRNLLNLFVLKVHRNVPEFFITRNNSINWDGSLKGAITNTELHEEVNALLSENFLTSFVTEYENQIVTDIEKSFVEFCEKKEILANYSKKLTTSILKSICYFYVLCSFNFQRFKSLIKLLAYSMVGVNVEKLFIIFWGPSGDNGKTTFFEILREVFKNSVGSMMQDSSNRQRMGNERDKDLAGNIQKKFVYVDDISDNSIDMSWVKDITGGGHKVCRQYYRTHETVKIAFTFCVSCNEPPSADGVPPDAFVNRLGLILWESKFTSDFLAKTLGEQIVSKQFYKNYLDKSVYELGFLTIILTLLCFEIDYKTGRVTKIKFADNALIENEFLKEMSMLLRFEQFADLRIDEDCCTSKQQVISKIRQFVNTLKSSSKITQEKKITRDFEEKYKERLQTVNDNVLKMFNNNKQKSNSDTKSYYEGIYIKT